MLIRLSSPTSHRFRGATVNYQRCRPLREQPPWFSPGGATVGSQRVQTPGIRTRKTAASPGGATENAEAPVKILSRPSHTSRAAFPSIPLGTFFPKRGRAERKIICSVASRQRMSSFSLPLRTDDQRPGRILRPGAERVDAHRRLPFRFTLFRLSSCSSLSCSRSAQVA
jgi:hypothetical protein